MEKRSIIYDNHTLNFDEWKEAYREMCENNEIEIEGEISDDAVWQYRSDCLNDEWDMIKYDLERHFENGYFVIVADLGRWNGTFPGGKVVNGYEGVAETWRCNDYYGIEIYELLKGGQWEMHVEGHHHDGTDHFVVKRLTDKGVDYYEKHEYDIDDRILHKRLFTNSKYSHHINLTKAYY